MDPLREMKLAEYAWVLHYIKECPKGIKVLDAGCGDGKVARILEKDGYDAWGIDLGIVPDAVHFAGETIDPKKYKAEDMRKTSFRDKTFDIIYCISTIINVGLGAYGDKKDPKGDRKAIEEFMRILKDDGKIILTLAYGEEGIRSRRRSYRVYDDTRLKFLFKDLEILEAYFFYWNEKEWKETQDRKKLIEVFSKNETRCLGNAYFVLRKKRG